MCRIVVDGVVSVVGAGGVDGVAVGSGVGDADVAV